MSDKTGYANVDTLSDIQTTEMQILFVGFQKFVKNVVNTLFNPLGEPITIWEVVLIQERLAQLGICLDDVLGNVVKVDENITVGNKPIVASLSTNEYQTIGETK